MVHPTRFRSLHWRLLIGALLLVALLDDGQTIAQETPNYAGIVIRPGDGTVTYAYVPLDQPISGIELLQRSGISLLTVSFGGLGQGVCRIEETGCDVSPCRTRLCQTGDRESPYWRYFQQDHSGQWVASPLGGSTAKIAPGEVDGWSWTPDAANLPDVAIGDIPQLAGANGELGGAHFARYDANGVLVSDAIQPSSNRSARISSSGARSWPESRPLPSSFATVQGTPHECHARTIDPRAWLCWAGSAMLMPLMGRNPFALLSVLLAVLAVREALPPDARIGWSWIVRLAVPLRGALGRLQPAHRTRWRSRDRHDPGLGAGDRRQSDPQFSRLRLAQRTGGPHPGAHRSDPGCRARLECGAAFVAAIADRRGREAGSVAFSFFPQMVASYREIVDAQAMRGYELRGPRDYLNLAPLLLMRRYRARGDHVGVAGIARIRRHTRACTLAIAYLGPGACGLGILCIAVYLFAVGESLGALVGAITGGAVLAWAVQSGRATGVRRTRYRPLTWRRCDWLVLTGSAIAALSLVLAPSGAVRYEPYPTLTWPVASVVLTIGLLGLLAPAVVLLWQERSRT